MADVSLQAPATGPRLERSSRATVKLLFLWSAIAAAWGIVLNWRYWDFMNPDGISYLDIASEVLHTGPAALVNPHWSPLYPALLAFWESIHRPSPPGEFAYVHALNALIYTITAISFAYFLHELLHFRPGIGRSVSRDAIFVAFGFALFFHFMNRDVTPFVVTPDLLVAAAIFLSSGLFFRILRQQVTWRAFFALGIVLVFGYFAKSVMLPAGIILLCILLLQRPRSKSLRRGVLVAAITMLLIAAPQVWLVSKRVGHFSMSETGRLNYLWWVDGLPFAGWTGTPGGDKPLHGPRVIEDSPKIIEFASPIPGTYPLWYDPAYWLAGAKVRIDLKRQIPVIRNSLHFYNLIFPDLRLPLEGLVFLLILAYASRNRLGRHELLFLIWPVAILSMYALLVTEYRYAAPFLVIFWIAAYSAVLGEPRAPASAEAELRLRPGWQGSGFSEMQPTGVVKVQQIVLTLLAAIMLFSSVKQTLVKERWVIVPATTNPPHSIAHRIRPREGVSELIAGQKLNDMGIKPGDAISTVGDAFDASYARVGRLHVLAEIVNVEDFWELDPEVASAAEAKLAATGAKALIALGRPEEFQPGLWQDIPGTGYSVLRLHK